VSQHAQHLAEGATRRRVTRVFEGAAKVVAHFDPS
jgi:hypothetical protein